MLDRLRQAMRGQALIVQAIWAILIVEVLVGLATGRLNAAFVALGTFALTLVPLLVTRRLGVVLPRSFLSFIASFTFAAIFLGELHGYYELYWWWDIMLHGLSALGMGLLAFLLIFMMFEGDRYAAPPWAIAMLTVATALAIGAVWEIFEYGMDQIFGFNMQKSGLDDTMGDLIVDLIGAAAAGISGFLYLKGRMLGGVGPLMEAFIEANRQRYRKFRDRERGRGRG